MTCSNMMMIWMEWKKQGTMKYSHKQLKYFPLQSLFKRFSNIIAMLWNASKYLFTKIFRQCVSFIIITDIENQHPDLGLDHQLDAPGHGQDLMNGIETELVG